jgi:Mg2+-importing ATPase
MAWAPDLPPVAPPGHLDVVAPRSAAPSGDWLRQQADAPLLAVLRGLETGPRGLTEVEAQQRLARHGANVLPDAAATRLPVRLLALARDPFTVLLAVLAVASALIGSVGGALVVGVLVLVGGTLRFTQERRAEGAVRALRALVSGTASVWRRAAPGAAPLVRELPTDQLVPGDVVRLTAGDVVPADLRLLRANALTVGQAAFSGESLPARKIPADGENAASVTVGTPADHPSLCLAGSTVLTGTGTGVVLATGRASHLAGGQRARAWRSTSYQRGMARVSWVLIGLTVLSVVGVLAATTGGRYEGMRPWLFAASVAIGLTPEMLPVVAAAALARGTASLARVGVLVTRLPALHDLGAATVLCVDKTGTLTTGQLTLERAVDPSGAPDPEVLRWAALNAHGLLEHAGAPIDDPIDEALLAADLAADPGGAAVIAALPFDADRRCATVVLRAGRLGAHTLITKGAVPDVLERCTALPDGTRLDPRRIATLHAYVAAAERRGTRLVAVATAERSARGRRYAPDDEYGLTLRGFVGLRDAPKPAAAGALAALRARGVAVVVLSGDTPGVVARVRADLGLPGARPRTGADIAGLDDSALAALVGTGDVTAFARLAPADKARVVTALRTAGHTVAYLGDGVNDVPALAAADVGVSVRDAVPAAREAADVVLGAKDLGALDAAVAEGRRTAANIAGYLRITVSANLGNVLSMIVASLLLPYLPMLPAQVLVQNLCFDLTQLTLAFDRVDGDSLTAPRRLDAWTLVRFAGWLCLANALADVGTFTVLWQLTGGGHGARDAAMLRTGWLAENLLTQALAIHLLRGGAPDRWRRPAARVVLLASGALAVAAVLLPFLPGAALLGLRPPPAAFWVWLLAVLVGFAVLTRAMVAGWRRLRLPWP